MTKLDEARKEINLIDAQMAKLFEARMRWAKEIAIYKRENALPIFDKTREKELIEKNKTLIDDDDLRGYYISFLEDLMNISKKYQSLILSGMKVAYSGVEGAFAYIAAKRLFPTAQLIAYNSFDEAYRACENGTCDSCVLPIENSYAGDVGTVMDLIFSRNLYINQILDLDVVHNLIVKKGTKAEQIKKVISHPQALSQCDEYIKKHGYEVVECANTAISAKLLLDTDGFDTAAIASDETAELYGLEILESHINSSSTNTTRFAAFAKNMNLKTNNNKMGNHFIIVFTVKNEAGALAKTLNIIGSHSYNMRSLRSRPMKSLMWSYYFYVELEGDGSSSECNDMMNELKSVCDCLKLVGTYSSNN